MTLHFQAKVTILLIVGWKWNLCAKKFIFIWNCLSNFVLLKLDWGEDGWEAPFVPPPQYSRIREEHTCVSEHLHGCVCVHVLRALRGWDAHRCTVLLPNTGARQEFQLIKAWLAIYWHEGCRGGGWGCQLKSLVVKHLPHGNPAAAVPFALNPSTHIRC